MPKLTETDTWVKEYRDLLRGEMLEKHKWKWSVGNHNGSIRLQVNDGKKQTKVLPFDWSKKGLGKAIPEILQIYKRFYEGKKQLSAACKTVKVSSSNYEIDLTKVIADFRKDCPNASDKTWNKSYVPVLSKCQELLERSKGKPQNSKDLMALCLQDWEYGSRARQIARRALQKFLNFAVSNEKLSMQYAPIKIAEKLKSKRVGYALTDSQILQLIASEKDPRWQLNFQLLAVYGLRPEELRFLVVKDGIKGKELWTTYEKSMGGNKGQKTEPRKLAPLYVKDGQGYIDWNLIEKFENEELAPVGILGKGSDALRTRLIRNPLWNKFRKQAAKQKEVLVPYAFRHRYAKVAHERSVELNLSTVDIAFVMGHTPEVHQQSYARFIPTDTFSKFDKQLVA